MDKKEFRPLPEEFNLGYKPPVKEEEEEKKKKKRKLRKVLVLATAVLIILPLTLRTGLFSKELFDPYVPTIPPFDDNVIILEVKYNHALPTYIRDLLGEYCQGAQHSAISKYTWCRRFEGMGEE